MLNVLLMILTEKHLTLQALSFLGYENILFSNPVPLVQQSSISTSSTTKFLLQN